MNVYPYCTFCGGRFGDHMSHCLRGKGKQKRYVIDMHQGFWYIADMETGEICETLVSITAQGKWARIETYEICHFLYEWFESVQFEIGMNRFAYLMPESEIEVAQW